METYTKSERLCNFTYKDLLFRQGQRFFSYPFRVFFLVLEKNLEPLFFKDSCLIFEAAPEQQTFFQRQQNPSWPHQRIPENALFFHPAKCLISVPRKRFKRAVDRNHIKRIVKEAYRKNKTPFYTFLQDKEVFCLLGLVYAAQTPLPFQETETKILITLQKLQEAIAKEVASRSNTT